MTEKYTTVVYDTSFRIWPDGTVTNRDGSPMSLEKMARCAPAVAQIMKDADALASKPAFLNAKRATTGY